MDALDADTLVGLAPLAPLEAHLRVSNGCSFGCAHCPYFFPRERSVVRSKTVSRIVRLLAEQDVLHVLLIAPDCRVAPWLPDLVSSGRALGMDFDLLTGGPMPQSRLWSELFRSGLSTAIFEVFGGPETHDEAVLANSYQETLAAITLAVDAGLKVVLLLRPIAGLLPDPVRFAAALPKGVAGVAVQYLIPFRLGQEMFSPGESQCFASWRGLSLAIGPSVSVRYVSCARLPEPAGLKLCSAGRFKIAVDPDGTVRPCEHFDLRPSSALGNLFSQPIARLWEGTLLARIRKLVPGTYRNPCGACDDSRSCSVCCAPGFNRFGEVEVSMPVCEPARMCPPVAAIDGRAYGQSSHK